jgi:hypothetical protein
MKKKILFRIGEVNNPHSIGIHIANGQAIYNSSDYVRSLQRTAKKKNQQILYYRKTNIPSFFFYHEPLRASNVTGSSTVRL